MKVALVSDIHGNVKNLRRFLHYVNKERINIILNAGDILGGDNPVEALRIIMKDKRFINVCGNHDEDIEFIKDELTEKEINWLKALPNNRVVNIENKKILLLHSRIDDNKDIPLVFNGKTLEEFLEDYSGDWEYVVFGHTHYQCLLSFYTGKTMINPGSLGLSYDEKASFAIIQVIKGRFDINYIKLDNV